MEMLKDILFLDIETVPLTYKYTELDENSKQLWDAKWKYAKDESPEALYGKSGIYAEFAKIICIGLGYFHQGKFRVTCLANDNEKELLYEFRQLVEKHFNKPYHKLCAHNGKEFDFPFLCRRFIINELGLPDILKIQGLKPWEVRHLDTMEMWKFGDYKNFTSLNLLAHVFNIPSPKDDIDGSQVSKVYYENKDLEKIKNYCLKDVITLARVYSKFTNSGNIDEENIVRN